MVIAVTYDKNDGSVFQHFGKCEAFKLYVTDGKTLTVGNVIDADGAGHEALAGFLKSINVDMVICGGLGEGMQAALAEADILVISGTSGDADAAVQAFLEGNLSSTGANCSEHEGGCGGDCGGNCGGGCGGCGGGCGGQMQILYEGPNAGKQVKVHYTGTLDDGTKFDSSYDRGEPLAFICAVGMMIPGFDKAVVNMNVGDVIDIHLEPEEAYGMPDPRAIITFDIEALPGSEELEVGQKAYLSNSMGQPVPVTVLSKEEGRITFDSNHELAGKALNFHVELLEVAENE